MESPKPLQDKGASDVCPNCGQANSGVIVGLNKRKRDEKGKQYNPFSVREPMYAPKDQRVASKVIEAKKEKPRVSKNYISEEIKQCPNLNEGKRKKKVDYTEEDIMKSCLDLAIDG